MDNELLMLQGAAFAVSQMIDAGSSHFRMINAGRMEDAEWHDILDYLSLLIEERKENGGK